MSDWRITYQDSGSPPSQATCPPPYTLWREFFLLSIGKRADPNSVRPGTRPTGQYWHRTEHLIGPRGSQTRSNLNRVGLGWLQDCSNRVWLEIEPDRSPMAKV